MLRRVSLLVLLSLLALPALADAYGFEYCMKAEELLAKHSSDRSSNCNASDAVWQAAAQTPVLCEGTLEHGVMSLRALRAAIDACCGCHCVFPASMLPKPPSSSLGWNLDSQLGCWQEASSADSCARSFWETRPRHTPPLGVRCGEPEGNTAQAPPRLHERPCDLILSPEEQPPNGFCGPRVVLTGAMQCDIARVATALRLHPRVSLKQAPFAFRLCDVNTSTLCGVVADADHAAKVGMPVGAGYVVDVDRAAGQCGDILSFTGRVSDEKLCAPGCRCRLGADVYEQDYFTFRSNYPMSPATPARSSASLAARREYAQMLAETSGEQWTFDTSSSYFSPFHPDMAARVKQLLPHAKVVVAVCDPVQRLLAQFNNSVTYGSAGLRRFGIGGNFSRLLESFNRTEFADEAERYALHGHLLAEYVERGYYAQLLMDWLAEFGSRNVLVLDGTRWSARSTQQLLNFLDLDAESYNWMDEQRYRVYAAQPALSVQGVGAEEREAVRRMYADHNHWLRKLTRLRFD
jgi:hypothetical protein